ncbi:hypothetical protein ACNKHO_22200 [Shigella flexneri]
MLNQKIQNPNPDELMIEVDLCYELDPYELKLDEMQFQAEPEPEMIEGLPASDALTPADRYLEPFEHVQSSRPFADSKTFPDRAPEDGSVDILIRYRKARRHRDFRPGASWRITSGCRRTTAKSTSSRPLPKEHIEDPVAGADARAAGSHPRARRRPCAA